MIWGPRLPQTDARLHGIRHLVEWLWIVAELQMLAAVDAGILAGERRQDPRG